VKSIAYDMLYLIVRGSRRLSDMYTGAEWDTRFTRVTDSHSRTHKYKV
jgi:hypothetical protein